MELQQVVVFTVIHIPSRKICTHKRPFLKWCISIKNLAFKRSDFLSRPPILTLIFYVFFMNNKYFPRKGNPLKLTENILSTFWFELWRSKFWNRIIQSLAWSLSSLTKGSKAKHWRDGVRSICWERKINYVENCCEGIFTKKDFHKIQPSLCI